MKKKNLFLVLFLLLVACAESVTVVDEVTLSAPPAIDPTQSVTLTEEPVLQETAEPVAPVDEVAEGVETAVPTPTMMLPPTLEPTAIPIAIETATEDLPTLSRSVLALADNRFVRWDVQRNSITDIMTANAEFTLTQFTASKNGEWAVVAERIREADPAIYDLYRVNTISGEVTLWISRVPELRYLQLSPDGTQLLYVSGQPSEEDAVNTFQNGDVKLVPLLQDAPARDMGVCRSLPEGVTVADEFWLGRCTGLAWTPDSQNMLWADVEGVWIRHKDASEGRLLLSSERSASSGEVLSLYEPMAWARNGRYLLLRQIYFEGLNWAVLDVATGDVRPVPESGFGPGTGFVDVQWMQDDRLLVLRENLRPTLQLVRVQEDLSMTVEETVQPEFPPDALLAGGVHLENGRFSLLIASSNPETRGVYLMASSNEPAVKMNQFPFMGPYQTNPVWVMDGSGLFLLPTEWTASMPYYIANNENAPAYDLTPHLGQDIQQLEVITP